MIASAANAPCSSAAESGESNPLALRANSITAAVREKAAEINTTRRDAERDASTGTTTSQIAANELVPPVYRATSSASPLNDSEESTCALSYRPVRDR